MNSVENRHQKVAVIVGCTGQDSSYLAEFLLNKGYIVHGIVRRSSSFNRGRIEHLYDFEDRGDFILHYGDITDPYSLTSIFSMVQPDEIYNMAAQSHVQVSFDTPYYTAQVDAVGVLNVLEAVRSLGFKTKIYQASTSELFSGDSIETPQNESTPFRPRSPYGVAKLYGFNIARIYRESYGMFVVNGILFNHESPRRGENFVTRKITLGLRDILEGRTDHITLGDIDTMRDWGHARDYVEAMWLMLQQSEPQDFVIATGETHTVREFLELSFKLKGLDYRDYVRFDDRFKRPNEVRMLLGDPSKAKKILGWEAKTKFFDLVKEMVEEDCSFKS